MPLASLVEHIWNKVAEDTREEIEDAAETKVAETEAKWTANYNKAQAEIDSLKRQIEFQDGSILDLQKQNDTLTKELDLLKSNIGSPYAKVEEKPNYYMSQALYMALNPKFRKAMICRMRISL